MKKRDELFGIMALPVILILVIVLLCEVYVFAFLVEPDHSQRHVSYPPKLSVHEDIYIEPTKDGAVVESDSIVEPTQIPSIVETYDPAPSFYYSEPIVEEDGYSAGYYEADYFQAAGVIYDGDTKYTWYSQNVLPGGGLDIPGRHVENGYVVDETGRIVVASSDLPYGTEVELPFGSGVGVVLDTGYLEPGQIDVYTDF